MFWVSRTMQEPQLAESRSDSLRAYGLVSNMRPAASAAPCRVFLDSQHPRLLSHTQIPLWPLHLRVVILTLKLNETACSLIVRPTTSTRKVGMF